MTTETLGIRPATVADVDSMLEIYAPLVHESIATFETEPPTPEDFKNRIRDSQIWLVSEVGRRIAGYAYASWLNERAAYRWSVAVSVYVHPDNQRSGVGRALTTELLAQLTTNGFVNAFAGVALPNDGSVRLFESLGFERIALQKEVGFKLGRWIDVGWWQKHLRDRPTNPPEPLGVEAP